MTTDTTIASSPLNITKDDVMGVIKRIIVVDGLDAARAAFKQMNEYFSGMKGWPETTEAVYPLFAEKREEEKQKLREEKLEEQRAGAPNILVQTNATSASEAKTIGTAEIKQMDVEVKSPGNNIARIIKIGDNEDEK